MAKEQKPVSVSQLKTFIEAVEFAADAEDWVPSKRQWERIRDMIERLEEVAPAAPSLVPQAAPVMMQLPVPQMASTFVPGPGGLQMPSAPNISQLPGPFGSGGPAPVRTPDVDTSGGRTYQSTFA